MTSQTFRAIDWATRPPSDRAIAGTVVAFLSAAGRSGGQHSQDSVTPVLGVMGASIVADPQVRLSLIGDRIDADGHTDDPEIIDAVAAKLCAVVDALALRNATPEA